MLRAFEITVMMSTSTRTTKRPPLRIKRYIVKELITQKAKKFLSEKNEWGYSCDRWGANVKASWVTITESFAHIKLNGGTDIWAFDWMVDSILEHGKILDEFIGAEWNPSKCEHASI